MVSAAHVPMAAHRASLTTGRRRGCIRRLYQDKSFWGDICCAHAAVVETGDRLDFSAVPRSGLPGINDYLNLLALPGKIVGHNFCAYDPRCLVKRLGAKIDFSEICDTLTASTSACRFA